MLYFTPEEEDAVRRWWLRNKLRGRRMWEAHGEDGQPDTLRLEITIKGELPEWITRMAGPPEGLRRA